MNNHSDMPAGPEIDRLVAEKVMGLVCGIDFGEWPEHQWKKNKDGTIDDFGLDADIHNGPSCERCWYSYCQHCQDLPSEPCKKGAPPYSDSLTRAWEVVERLQRNGFGFALTGDDRGHVSCEFWKHDDDRAGADNWHARGNTMSEAICRCALKAMA